MTDREQDNDPDDGTGEFGDLADHPLTAQRLEKHLAIGNDEGYPYRFERTAMAAELHQRHAGLAPAAETDERVTVAGRILNIRRMGKLSFAVLQDGSGTIQLFVNKRNLGDEEFDRFEDLVDIGDWVGAEGEVITTKKGELSVRIGQFTILAKSLRPLPDKWHGLTDVERRYRQRYVDLAVNPQARSVALARAAVVKSLRDEFHKRGYIEVETPVLQGEPGGALAKPFATHHNALGIDMYLRIATELHLKRLIVGGLERVFELGKVFRNEGIDTTHNPEFTTLEAYEAFADYTDIMQMMEEIYPAVATAVTGSPILQVQGRELDLSPPYRRVSVIDLASEFVGRPLSLDDPVEELRDIAWSHGMEVPAHALAGAIIYDLFDDFVSSELWEPTFVIDHPAEVSPLARRHRKSPGLTERFELFIAGQEMCDAFSELIDPLDQRERFEIQAALKAAGADETHPVDDDFLRALEYGMPPTGGLGIGVDRLTMLLTDQTAIREVILFPQLRPE